MATIAEAMTFAVQQHQAGNYAQAEQVYRQVLQVAPRHADALHLLGILAHQTGRAQMAVDALQQAVAIEPNNAIFLSNFASLLQALGKPAEALECCQRAIRADPNFADAYYNQGTIYERAGYLEQAVNSYRQAIARRPNYPMAHNNLGLDLTEMGRPTEALLHYEQALRLDPNYARAHWNYSLTLLMTGDFERGWTEYAWRLRCPELPTRQFPQPYWDGSPLGGRTILLHAEQGLGDMMQFVRYAPLVQERGGRVIVECPPSLVRLLTRCAGVEQVFATGSPLPPFDVHAPLLSLPGLFGTNLGNIPAAVPYLHVDPALQAKWKQELPGDGLRVGLVWQGRATHPRDRLRSMPLRQFVPLAKIEGVRLFSLQKGQGIEQLNEAGLFPIIDLGPRISDLADTAAILQQLDLLICVDTAPAHLAGGLGVPVWVLLPFVPDWRWLLHRSDSPWYPSMRLFRQGQVGDWDGVLGWVEAALRERVREPRP